MTKDKKYIENLFRNYKKNIARKKILELGLITDDDYTLGAIDYSSDNVQTSNIATLDNRIIAREKELEKLKYEISLVETLLDSLKDKEKVIMEAYYIEGKTQVEVANIINVYDLSTVWRNREKILDNLIEIVKAS